MVGLVAALSLTVASAGIGSAAALPQSAPPTRAIASGGSGGDVDGTYDVRGHSLYLKCTGTGSPTVVYMHGAIWDDWIVPHRNAEGIRDQLGDGVRFCAYDRRNVGFSDTVDAQQSPQDALRDLEWLMAAAGEKPPYVLLGASAGGVLAYLYANSRPDQVVGMVLLDSMFPDELSLEHLFPKEDRYLAFCKDDRENSLERLCHWKMLKMATTYMGREPNIPMTYFASLQAPRNVNDWGIPAYDAAILGLQSRFVSRFAPGKEVWVDSPHFMEPYIPAQIAAAVRDVITTASH
jgi:pimeloyl-ACP methyl ester carboxylesterase